VTKRCRTPTGWCWRTSRLIRELVLGQSAYDPHDACSERGQDACTRHGGTAAAPPLARGAGARRGARLAAARRAASRARALPQCRADAAPDRFNDLQRLLDELLTLGAA
jgi:hypothetical protein